MQVKGFNVLPDGWLDADARKFCLVCGNSVNQATGWTSVGSCKKHDDMFLEDARNGFKQNRVLDIIESRKKQLTDEPHGNLECY